MNTTQETMTLPIYQSRTGKAQEIGVFRAMSHQEAKSWSIPVSEPCTFCIGKSQLKGYLTFTVTTQEEADRKNAWKMEHRIPGPYLNIGDTYDILCGGCHGTLTRQVDTTPSHIWFKSNTNDARQAKLNGKVRTWKRDLTRIEIPCKYGLYEYFTLDKYDIEQGRLLVRIS